MQYGIMIFPTEYSIRIEDLARAAEQRGFESLLVAEHTHIPVSRRTPFPGGGELPREYLHTLDPFVALTAAATVTKNLKVATGICLVVEHDPIILAKEVASIDYLSNGRFLFGIGAGWNAEEMYNHGTAFESRRALLRERVLAMKAIWTHDEAQFHGRFVNFDPIWSYPKPVQKPHPPILMGGGGVKAMQAVVEYCDGWMPLAGRVRDLLGQIAELRRMAEAANRDPASISISIYWAPPNKAAIEEYAKAGVERVGFALPSEGAGEAMRKLDEYAKLIEG